MTAAAKFRVQHVAPAPRGWKIRTKLSGAHRVRIAVPPQGGKAQLVEILHPAGENPCQMKNPAQLVILGNPAKKKKGNPAARDKGLSPTRKAARRRVAIRRQLRSMGQPLDAQGAESLRQLRAKRKKALGNPSERKTFDTSTAAGLRQAERYKTLLENKYDKVTTTPIGLSRVMIEGRNERQNPDGVAETKQAVDLYRSFQGKDPQAIVTRQRSAAMRTDYTALGPLLGVGLYVPGLKIPSPDHWDEYPHLKFERDVILASNAQGSQLYAIGGNQDCSGCLESVPNVDTSKDLVEIGEIAFVVYLANKAPSFRATEYMHTFDAPRPSLGFDQIKREIFFVGGGYTVEAPGIVH